MPDPFNIADGPAHARATVLRVTGELDSTSAPVLAERCRETLRSRRTLVLNLESVSFIASSGVGVLLAAAEEFDEAGCELHLVALSPAVASVLRLLNLDQFLNIKQTEDEALSTLKAA